MYHLGQPLFAWVKYQQPYQDCDCIFSCIYFWIHPNIYEYIPKLFVVDDVTNGRQNSKALSIPIVHLLTPYCVSLCRHASIVTCLVGHSGSKARGVTYMKSQPLQHGYFKAAVFCNLYFIHIWISFWRFVWSLSSRLAILPRDAKPARLRDAVMDIRWSGKIRLRIYKRDSTHWQLCVAVDLPHGSERLVGLACDATLAGILQYWVACHRQAKESSLDINTLCLLTTSHGCLSSNGIS